MNYKPYSFSQYTISLVVFLAFVYGSDLFGLLRSQVAKFLGTLSYSIYLIHGIILFAIQNSFDYFYPILSIHPAFFWLLILISGLLTIVASSITYRFIEYPFIKMIKSQKSEAQNGGMADKVM